MSWMRHLLRMFGNDGAVANARGQLDREMAVMAYLETLAVRLALVEPNGLPVDTVQAA